MRTEFFANISHEFRTPLNMIFTSLQMCELVAKNIRNDTHDELKNINKYTRIIRQNSYRLIKMVDNLIDLNKIDAEYFRLYLSNINIVSLVEDITLSVVEYAKNKNIDLLFDTNTEELLVACDGDKIEKIILNLLSNSIKFTPPGGEVLVNIEEMEKNLLITVEDNGIGIPSDKQKLIFDRFIQVDKSLSRNNEGSGIGLSLIKSLVEMHKGKIWVESESGKGSKFFVQIPKRTLKEKSFCNNNILENGSKEKTIEIEFSDVYFS
ncbi:HAMP domain-containing sensor histidine kinase [Clostridium rectalis]|uniref:sensor histidine kinase n=1 Tax=Clostridium rectalis TaxID=2040295 RepID=UPI00311AA1A3